MVGHMGMFQLLLLAPEAYLLSGIVLSFYYGDLHTLVNDRIRPRYKIHGLPAVLNYVKAFCD